MVGLGVSLAVVAAGTAIGMLAGYFKRVDTILMRLMDSMMAFPGVILALAIMSVRGPGIGNVIIALTIVDTPRFARVVRSVVLTIRELQYIEAAHALGIGNSRIMLRHILPNCLSPMIVQATFVFAAAVLGEAGLSFLGAGTPPEIPSWGQMLADARNFLAQATWTMVAHRGCLDGDGAGLELARRRHPRPAGPETAPAGVSAPSPPNTRPREGEGRQAFHLPSPSQGRGVGGEGVPADPASSRRRRAQCAVGNCRSFWNPADC